MNKWNDFGIGTVPDAIQKEYMECIIHPPREQLFRAFETVPYNDVKAVILGQDPYHKRGQANGLAFSVNTGVPLPPSLKNIYKEMGNISTDGDLGYLAEQGVLLMNTVLSVRDGSANSHRGMGWEEVTDKAIAALNVRDKPLVFLLWGSNAREKQALITNPIHLVLTAPHPSPLSAHRGFFGCNHFVLANQFLEKTGQKPIMWIEKSCAV